VGTRVKARGARSRAAAAAIAVVPLTLLIGVANPASGDQAPGALTLEADELTASLDVPAVTKAAERRFGEDYGGAWIDRSSGHPVLEIAVAGSGDPARLASGRLGEPGIELVPAELGAARLERSRDHVIDALAEEGTGPIVVDADQSRGGVVVEGALDPAARAEIEAAAAGPVSFEQEALNAELVRESCFVCYPPWRANLPIRSGKALCTGAFTVRQGKRAKHKFRALTAGHCQTNRRQVYVADRKIGKITANSFRGKRRITADAMRFKVPRKQRRAQVATAQFGDVPVIAKLPDRALVPGQFLCFGGRTTGGGCGYLSRQDIALKLGKKIFTHLWCVNVPTRPGDSGGPVVQDRGDGAVRAVGLVGLTLQTATTDEMCFSSINLALKKLNVHLLSASR